VEVELGVIERVVHRSTGTGASRALVSEYISFSESSTGFVRK
jgi:hypothetical protein